MRDIRILSLTAAGPNIDLPRSITGLWSHVLVAIFRLQTSGLIKAIDYLIINRCSRLRWLIWSSCLTDCRLSCWCRWLGFLNRCVWWLNSRIIKTAGSCSCSWWTDTLRRLAAGLAGLTGFGIRVLLWGPLMRNCWNRLTDCYRLERWLMHSQLSSAPLLPSTIPLANVSTA